MISVSIIHTPGRPERSALVAVVLEQLPHARVLLDVDGRGDYRIANRRGCWPMAWKAWQTASADHHLVLEDDAVLCADFPARLAEVIAMAPRSVLSLFRGKSWCSVATVMPRDLIAPWLAWTERESKIRPHHDQLIDIGCQRLGMDHRYTNPSLVEHAPTPSLLGHPHVAAIRLYQPGDAISLVDAAW